MNNGKVFITISLTRPRKLLGKDAVNKSKMLEVVDITKIYKSEFKTISETEEFKF